MSARGDTVTATPGAGRTEEGTWWQESKKRALLPALRGRARVWMARPSCSFHAVIYSCVG